MKTVYAPLRVYANNKLIYEYGQPGSYPKYLHDPPTAVGIIPLGDAVGTVHMRFEYLSPVSRSELTVHPPLLGSETAILRSLSQSLGFSFVFSVVLILIGLFMLLTAVFVVTFERKGSAIVWLGLFSLCVGFWTFGECNLTGLLISDPTLLYLMAFTGLFTLPVPLINFGLEVVDFHHRRLLTAASLGVAAAAALALLAQLTGIYPLSSSMYVFHAIVTLALCIFAGDILYEALRYKTVSARRFLAPMAVIALFSVLEVINYQLHFTYVLGLFFQLGVIVFILMTGAVGGMFIREAMRLNEEKQRLEYEMELMEYRVDEQRKHQRLLLDNQETVRRQRHDLRHQLAVIRTYNEKGDREKLGAYIDSLVSDIPVENAREYCQNSAANAIVSHYASLAEGSGVQLSIKLDIPEQVENISDSSLCVILGNLLENAVDACGRMTDGEKFIRLRSRLQYGTLTITMDNSFDGNAQRRDGDFISSKRGETGVGLRSVKAVAEKHGGGASFDTKGGVFLSSIYIRV